MKTLPTAKTTAAFGTLHAAKTPMLTKLAIGRISEDLVGSPQLRAEFVANSSGFLQSHYGIKPTADEANYFNDLAGKFSDGLCCGGCACSSPAGGIAERVIK